MVQRNDSINSIKVNRDVLYGGEIGKNRERFCVEYINFKRPKLQEIKASQIEFATGKNLNISCRQGCDYCCNEFIKASLQECEAIVYYLFSDETKLRNSYSNFLTWRDEIQKHPNVLQELHDAERGVINNGFNEKSKKAISSAAIQYSKLNMYCPFLHNKSCLIYEIRPWCCASLISTSPSEWCNPQNANNPNQHSVAPLVVEPDLYDSRLNHGYRIEFMPYTVMGIICKSILYYRDVPGLEFLTYEQSMDASVKQIIKNIKRSK